MKVYTKTGDKGQTSLYDGSRVDKDHQIFDVIGDIDELNSGLGIIYSHLSDSTASHIAIKDQLKFLMSRLLDMGSFVATPKKNVLSMEWKDQYKLIERWIDEWDKNLPPLKNFILPTGPIIASHTHMARTVCRRVERRFISLTKDTVDPYTGPSGSSSTITQNAMFYQQDDIKIFLNRLSDYLFTIARVMTRSVESKDIIYSGLSTHSS